MALAEVAACLILDYGLDTMADDLERRAWEGVTAGQLYREIEQAAA